MDEQRISLLVKGGKFKNYTFLLNAEANLEKVNNLPPEIRTSVVGAVMRKLKSFPEDSSYRLVIPMYEKWLQRYDMYKEFMNQPPAPEPAADLKAIAPAVKQKPKMPDVLKVKKPPTVAKLSFPEPLVVLKEEPPAPAPPAPEPVAVVLAKRRGRPPKAVAQAKAE